MTLSASIVKIVIAHLPGEGGGAGKGAKQVLFVQETKQHFQLHPVWAQMEGPCRILNLKSERYQ